jgi:hypothetical protein
MEVHLFFFLEWIVCSPAAWISECLSKKKKKKGRFDHHFPSTLWSHRLAFWVFYFPILTVWDGKGILRLMHSLRARDGHHRACVIQ